MNKTLKQLIRESWLPALGGLGWMISSATFSNNPADHTLARHLGALASGFFFFGYLAAQYLRISREQRSDSGGASVVTQLNSVAGRLEDGVSWMTGGDSFCWVDFIDLNSTTADDLTAANIRVNNGGRYPMYDVSASVRLGGHPLARETPTENTASGSHLPQFFDFQNVPIGNYRQISGHRLRLNGTPILRASIAIFARNGATEQAMTLRNVGKSWYRATQVVRDGKRIHSFVERGFPRRLDGSPDW